MRAWQFSLAAFHTGIGGVLRRQDDLAGALEQCRQAYALRQQLSLKDPTNPGRQNSLAFAGIAVADLLHAQKQNLDEAMKLWRAAIEIWMKPGRVTIATCSIVTSRSATF